MMFIFFVWYFVLLMLRSLRLYSAGWRWCVLHTSKSFFLECHAHWIEDGNGARFFSLMYLQFLRYLCVIFSVASTAMEPSAHFRPHLQIITTALDQNRSGEDRERFANERFYGCKRLVYGLEGVNTAFGSRAYAGTKNSATPCPDPCFPSAFQ